MQTDFLDAHERHWDDAERLFQAQRWANADHLYGMAAECGLKRLMRAFDMPLEQERPKEGSDRRHADEIWVRYESYQSGHRQGAGYALPRSNPFANWKISQRYAHQSDFDQPRVQAHQLGASVVRELIQKAESDGLI